MGASGLGHGDRVVYLGIGQRRGKHADVLGACRGGANVRFDDGAAMLVLLDSCHAIPRRPPPCF